LTVNPVTDLSAADDAATGDEDTTISSTVAANDSTSSGGVLTYAVDTGVTNGSLVFNSDGSYDYTPNANFVGTDSFTYTVTDAGSGESSIQTVTLTINPVTDLNAADDAATGDEDTTISSSVATNDSTTSGGVLTYAVDTGVTNGSLVFNSDGSYDYTPNANFNGTDSFTYTVTDAASGEMSLQTVSITVNSVDDAPTLDLDANNDSGAGAADYTTTFTEGSAAVSISDVDVSISDLDSTQIQSATITVTDVEAGDLLNVGSLPAGITASAYDPVSGRLTLSGNASFADYQAAIRSIQFTNDGSSVDNTRTVEVSVSDGTSSSNVAVTTVNVVTLPTVSITDVSVQEPVAGTIALVFTVSLDQTLASDLTFDYSTVDISAIAGADYVGAASSGTILAGDTTTTISVTINSDANNFEGDETFSVDLANFNQIVNFASGSHLTTDGVQAIGTIDANNGAPDAVDDSYITEQGAPLVISTLLDNDALVDGATVTGFTQGANGTVVDNGDGTYTYTPTNPTFSGTDTFTYTLTDADGEVDTATVTVTVSNTPVNPPVVNSVPDTSYTENGAPTTLLSGVSISDVDSTNLGSVVVRIEGFISGQDSLTYLTAGTSVTGSVSTVGNTWELTLTGGADITEYQSVLGTLEYENLSDNPSSATRTITVEAYDEAYNNLFGADAGNLTVTPVNDAAEVFDNNNFSVATTQDNALNIIAPTDMDTDDAVLVITVTGLPTSIGTVTLSDGTPVNVNDVLTLDELTSLQFDASATDGTDVFTYSVFDGELTTVGTTTVNVGSSEADVNTVYESALPDGTDASSGLNVASGNLFSNDAAADGSTTLDSIDFNATNYTPDGSGIINIATPLGTLTVFADNTNPGYSAGDYIYSLNTNDTTSADVRETFTYNFTSGSPQQDTLTIDVIDDTPVANDLVETVPESEEKVFNIIFTLDDSGSMGWGAETGSTNPPAGEPTRMEIAQESLSALAEEYFNQSTQVTVTLITFNSSATLVGTYTDFTSFETALNSVTPGGGTNYVDATDEIQTEFFNDLAGQNPADNVQNISYFISDGEANDGTSPVGSGYLGFVNDNSIDSYAVGIGSSLPSDLSDLNYIHNIDSLGVGNGHIDEALIVADISQLEAELLSTVPTAFGGNIVANGSIQNIAFGADGGYVQSIEMELGAPATNYTFNYDGINITVTPALPTIEIDGSKLTLNSNDGFDYGTFTFDFADGSYSFIAPNGTAEATFNFDYTIIDGDGDTASATATIDIVDDVPDARDDLHSVDAYDAAEGNIITAMGTDGGPSYGDDFTPFATQGGGVDKIVDNAVVTEFAYRGSTISLDLTTIAQPDPSGTSDNVAINSTTNFSTTDITLSSASGVSFNGNGAGVGANSRLDSDDAGVPLTITFDSATLPYGVDNLVLGMSDYQGGNNDAVTLSLYDVSGNVLSSFTHSADNGTTIDLAGYSGIGSVDIAYSGGGFDAQLSNIAYDPTPAGFDTVPAGGDDGGTLSWVYSHETDLDGNDVFQATVSDSADGSVFIMQTNGYYNFTPDQTGSPVDVSVDTSSQANVDASDLNIAIRSGGTTLQYSGDGVGVEGGNGQLLSSGEALLVTFDAAALPKGVDNLVLTLNDFQSANTDQATIIVTHDTDGDGALSTDTVVFSASNAGSEILDLSQFSGVTQFDIEYTGGGWDLGLGNVSYQKPAIGNASTLQPELIDYTLTDSDGQKDTARLSIYTIDQIISGTVGADNIVGGSLNDAINGETGDDILAGGGGNDTVSGGEGIDTLYGDAGNDYLSGGADNDSLYGGADADYVDGEAGDDLVDGGTGDDIVQGGEGDDRIYGGAGNDKLEGEDGYDLLVGGAGDDSLFGGSGVDILSGGRENDTLTGCDDIDTFVWSNGDQGTEAIPAQDVINDFTVGVGGDVLDLADMLQGENSGNLTDYLHFESDGNGGTVIKVDTDGGGTFAETQQITLAGVDLTGGGAFTDQIILDNLLADGNLIVD
ncbi:MAG: tandem-95 repeat protein, partial [Gammaproteobacteria bacterium]